MGCINLDLLDEDLLTKDNIKKLWENFKRAFFPENLPKTLTILLLIHIVFITLFMRFKKNDKYVHIAMNIDLKYYYPCIVLLTSLMDNRADSTYYFIHLLTGNSITSTHKKNITSLIMKYGKSHIKVKFYNMYNDFEGATSGGIISIADYYRIALPSLLPNVDKIIYIDSDVINLKDLTEMYNIELSEYIFFKGILDFIGLNRELLVIKKHPKKYMNAGILMMNLKSMRKYGTEHKIRRYIFTHYLEHHDQTAINIVCHRNIDILSLKYAVFAFNSINDLIKYNQEQHEFYRYKKEELIKAFYEPTLLHYVGLKKPWYKTYPYFNQVYWWYYANKSDYYRDILNQYDFSEIKVKELFEKIPKDGGLLRKYK